MSWRYTAPFVLGYKRQSRGFGVFYTWTGHGPISGHTLFVEQARTRTGKGTESGL